MDNKQILKDIFKPDREERINKLNREIKIYSVGFQ
jgi:hypothetical protein